MRRRRRRTRRSERAGRSDDRRRSRRGARAATSPADVPATAWAPATSPAAWSRRGHDPADRLPELRPVPDDAGLAGADPAGRHPERHARRSSRQTRERWGLDKPLFPDQFVAYVDLHRCGRPRLLVRRPRPTVTEVLAQRLGPTLLLFGLGEIIAIVLGLALGAYSGWKRGGIVDYIGNGVSLILYSTPYFLLGMGLLLLFATGLGWFPTFGMLDGRRDLCGPLDQLADIGRAPVAAAGDGRARARRPVRDPDALVDRRDDERGLHHDARAKGLSDGRVLRSHALPNALLPTVTARRDQHRLRRRGRDHGRGRVQLAGAGHAHGRCARRAATTRSCRASSCS